MKEMIKSYHVFMPFAWERLMMYLLYPLLVVAAVWFCGRVFHPHICIGVCANFIIWIELFFDMLIFGGIAGKDTNKLEYIKTSAKGMEVLQSSLIGDGIRRGVSVTIIYLISFYLMYGRDMDVSPLVFCVLFTLFLVETGLVVARMISFIGIIMVMIPIIGVVAMSVIPMVALHQNILMVVSFLVLCAFAMVGERIIVMRRARRSYYDGRV